MVIVTPSSSSIMSNTTTEPTTSAIITSTKPSRFTTMPTLNGTVIPISNDDETSMILCTY